jgi:hypothetical protein
MPATKRPKPLYQRGEFKLFPGRGGGALEIVWYDERRKRERSRSAGTAEERKGRIAVDNLYVETHGGVPVCKECGRPRDQTGEKVAVLIANYLDTKDVKDVVNARLAHVIDFQEATGRIDDPCDKVDEKWATAFRDWLAAKTDRVRAPGTIENSLIQLGAAFRLGGVKPAFRTIPTTELNRTPQHRSDVAELARMFRFCLDPQGARTAKETERRRRERENLLRFLRASVATWARPDAVLEISTDPKRGQWHPLPRVLKLNPIGRRQTRKYRATVPIAKQFAVHLDATTGNYITVESIRSSWDSMAIELGLPADRQSGSKLIRRSVSHMVRQRIGEEHWVQGQIMLGHHKTSTSDLYALLQPTNLGRALAATEAIIDEIEALCPGAFYRDFTASGGNVASIARGKNL